MARAYKVAAGDTLAGIAQRFYGDGSLFVFIAAANQIADPNLLAVGQVISIPDLPLHWEVFQTKVQFNIRSPLVDVMVLDDSVPAGKRLVVTTVSGFYRGDGAVIGTARLSPAPGLPIRCALPWIQSGPVNGVVDGPQWFGFNHAVELYFNGPTQLVMEQEVRILQNGGKCTGGYHVSGFLEGLPPA